MALSVRITESLEGMESLREPWTRLLENSAADSVFLTWEWLSAWAETYLGVARKLFIIEIYEDSELVGLAPWCIRSRRLKGLALRQLESMGAPESGSDYLDVIIKRGKEKNVANHIYDFLWTDIGKMWDICIWPDLPANSYFIMHFLDRAQQEGKHFTLRLGSFCPLVVLPKDTEVFFSQLSANRRKQFRYDWNVLRRDGAIALKSSPVAFPDDGLLDSYFALYGKERGDDPHMPAFIKRYAGKCRAGAVQLDWLDRNGEILVGIVHIRYRGSLSLYLLATDKSFNKKISIGNVLVGLCIERAIEEHCPTYDFLKGTELYKFHWSNALRSSLSVVLYQRRLAPLLLLAGEGAKSLLKGALR